MKYSDIQFDVKVVTFENICLFTS